jgi:hypothetical protein
MHPAICRKSLTALSLLSSLEDTTATSTDVAALVSVARPHVLGFTDLAAGNNNEKRGSTAGGARSARNTRGSTAGGARRTAGSSGGTGTPATSDAGAGTAADVLRAANSTEASSLVCQVRMPRVQDV